MQHEPRVGQGRTTQLDQYTALPAVTATTTSGIAPITTVSVSGGTTQVTDANGTTLSWTYDSLNRKTSEYDAPVTGRPTATCSTSGHMTTPTASMRAESMS